MKYPSWVCHECGMKARGKPLRPWAIATYHHGKCDVCQEYKDVTEPRDFGYPEFKPKRKTK